MDLAHYFQESTQHIEDEPQVTSIIHAMAALLAYPACPATASLHTSPHAQHIPGALGQLCPHH